MEYKYLVQVYVPEIEEEFEFYIPANKHIKFVVDILGQAVNELEYGSYPKRKDFQLCNRRTGEVYEYGSYVRNTSIKNGTQLVLY